MAGPVASVGEADTSFGENVRARPALLVAILEMASRLDIAFMIAPFLAMVGQRSTSITRNRHLGLPSRSHSSLTLDPIMSARTNKNSMAITTESCLRWRVCDSSNGEVRAGKRERQELLLEEQI